MIKKFKNFVELQKKIKENEKNKLNNTITIKKKKANRNTIEGNFIRKTRDDFHISQNTSLSSSLNQQEVYLSIYDTQRIYFFKENNKILLRTHSMIFNNGQNKKINNVKYSKDIKRINNNADLISKNKTNKKSEIDGGYDKMKNKVEIKKLDQKTIKTIKNVIIKLNDFLKDNTTKKNKNVDYFKNKKYLKSNYDYILKNANKFLKLKLNKNVKKYQKKNKDKKSDLLINIKPIHPNVNNFKKITINEIKKLINNSNNNKLNDINNKEIKNDFSNKIKKYSKNKNKNHIIINREKIYKFTNEQLDKYKEIFDYIFIYLKLFFQKNIFNIIITYVNLKYKYISGFYQIIFFIKKKPFNFLRIIQQREYYQVILRQFFLPYLNKAFNKIKIYSLTARKFSDIELIIKKIYYTKFFKRMIIFIKIKENNRYEFDKIIEEEQDDISGESSSKNENKKKILNNDENNYNIKKENNNINNFYFNNYYFNNNYNGNENNSSNKENSESFDEIKELVNIFNIIINNISHSPKIYIFNLLKKYYLQSKNKDKSINYHNQNIKNMNDIDKKLNEVENPQFPKNLNDNKIPKNIFPEFNLINQQQTNDNIEEFSKNNNISSDKNNENENNSKNKKEIIDNIKYNTNSIINEINSDKEDVIYRKNKKQKNAEGEHNKRKKGNKKNIFSNKNNIKDDKTIVNSYTEEKNNIIINKQLNQNISNDSENIENISENKNLYNNKYTHKNKIDEENSLDNKELNNSKKSDLIKKFKFQNNEKNKNKRYSENNDLIKENSFENNKINIPNEIDGEFIDKLANEIINDLFKEEILNKNELLSNKICMNNKSNVSINELIRKDSKSKLSNSPGRKSNKLNSSQKLVPNNNEIKQNENSFLNNNIQDEDGLNTSIFMKTIYQIKKENELNFYEYNILPKLLSVIETNINKNYLSIIHNLKQPLKKNDAKIMNDLSNLITIDIIKNNDIIKYKSEFSNKNIIKKEYLDKTILIDFNNEIKNESILYDKYYFQFLNQCIYDSTNEIIKNKRIYGNIGEPLLWSLRNRIIEYKYKDTNLFQKIFISNIIKELKKYFFSKIGPIIENNENININQFSKERDIKYNQDIKEELIKENDLDKLDEQETIVKLMISKMIMNQLLNEVIEILEHVQYSRNSPERYNYKSIYCCDNIPLLSFQINDKNKYEEEEEEGEAEAEIEEEDEEKSEKK